MKLLVMICGLLLLNAQALAGNLPPLVVKYPAPMQGESSYPLELLRLIMKHSGVSYELSPVFMAGVSAERRMMFVSKGEELNIAWMAHPKNHPGINYIDIPIYRELSRYHVLYMNQETLPASEVKNTRFALVVGMPDIPFLKQKNLHVETPHKIHHALDMIQNNRADAIPVALSSLASFERNYGIHYPDVSFSKNQILKYKSPLFFHIAESHSVLYQAVETGFRYIVEHGIFDRFFEQHPEISYIRNHIDIDQYHCHRITTQFEERSHHDPFWSHVEYCQN